MTYELAKKLKDAGYEMDYNLDAFSEFDKRTAHIHLHLADLIEACGEEFFSLAYPGKDLWEAHQSPMGLYTQGKTPEEAVAKLWLSLNSESTTQKWCSHINAQP